MSIAGPGGSVYFSLEGRRVSRHGIHVLMAFAGVNDEIEIYDPHPSVSETLASSGRVRPVAG